jgi:hypothetical protein
MHATKDMHMFENVMIRGALLAKHGPFAYAQAMVNEVSDDPKLLAKLAFLGITQAHEVETKLQLGPPAAKQQLWTIWNVQYGISQDFKSIFASPEETFCQDRLFYVMEFLTNPTIPEEIRSNFICQGTRLLCNRLLPGDLEVANQPEMGPTIELACRLFSKGSLSSDPEKLIYVDFDITKGLGGQPLSFAQYLSVAAHGRAMNAFRLRFGQDVPEKVKPKAFLGPTLLADKPGQPGQETYDGMNLSQFVAAQTVRVPSSPFHVGPPTTHSLLTVARPAAASPFTCSASPGSSPQRVSSSQSAAPSQRVRPHVPLPAPAAVSITTTPECADPRMEKHLDINPEIVELIAQRLKIVGDELAELREDAVSFFKADGRMRDLRMLQGPDSIIALLVLFAVAASDAHTAAQLHVWNDYGCIIVVDPRLSCLAASGLFDPRTSPLKEHGFSFQPTPKHIQQRVKHDWAENSVTLQHKILEGVDVIGQPTESLERVVDALTAAIVFAMIPRDRGTETKGPSDKPVAQKPPTSDNKPTAADGPV